MKSEKLRSFTSFTVFIFFLLFFFHFSLFTLHPSLPESFAGHPQEEYRRLQKDLKTQKKKLESVKRIEQTVLEELRRTTNELHDIEKQLGNQREKIRTIQHNIADLREEIRADSAALQAHKSRLRKRLRTLLSLNFDRDAMLALISGEDISQTLRIMRYLKDVSAYDNRLIQKYRDELRILAEKETGLKRLHASLKTEEKKLAGLESSLKGKKKERETLLASVRKEKGIYENMIRELKESSNRLLRIIQESERQEREAKKKRSAKGRSGAKDEEPDEDSGFLRHKGKLPWPAQGELAVRYGSQVDPLFNLPVFRSGIHIKTDNGSPVRAVYGGKVVFADEFKGYGQLVIVSHGSGYHTLYGNLAKIFSKNGAIIKEHQTIGEVGESSTLGAPGLYFEIRYKGKPLDPQQWLRR